MLNGIILVWHIQEFYSYQAELLAAGVMEYRYEGAALRY
jgi:hypothetical protein